MRRSGEARPRELVETLNLGTFLTTDLDGTIRFWSKGCARLYGWTAAEAVGKLADDLLQTVRAVHFHEILAALEHNGEWIGEQRQVTRAGQELTVLVRAMLRCGANGRPREIVAALTDVTVQRQAEAALEAQGRALRTADQRARELEAELWHATRVSAVGEAASAMAHELAQPLTAATSFIHGCDLIVRSGGDCRKEDLLEGLGRGLDALARASAIVQDLHRFLRKEAERRDPVDVNAALRESVQLGAVGFERRGKGRVIWDLAPDLPEVFADRTQLKQVIANLVRNAIEAMAQDGVAVAELRIASVRTDEGIEISVADTGPGLPPEIAETPFRPFATTKLNGLGLGLSISRSIVESHGGVLRFETGPLGTKFQVIFPVAPGPPGAEAH
jgi:PAS domain S-box-containing protein